MRLVRQQPFVTSTLELAIQQNVKHPTRRDSDHFLDSRAQYVRERPHGYGRSLLRSCCGQSSSTIQSTITASRQDVAASNSPSAAVSAVRRPAPRTSTLPNSSIDRHGSGYPRLPSQCWTATYPGRLEESSGPSNNAPAGESARGEKVPRVCVRRKRDLPGYVALDTNFKDLFGNKDIRTMWFGQVIQSALVATVTGSYTPF